MWISKANHTYGLVVRATHVGLHFLAAGDRQLAEVFGTLSGDDVDKFERCQFEDGPFDVPVLTTCANRVVAERVSLIDEGGDHICLVTAPLEVTSDGPFEPLRFSAVEDLDPGHPADGSELADAAGDGTASRSARGPGCRPRSRRSAPGPGCTPTATSVVAGVGPLVDVADPGRRREAALARLVARELVAGAALADAARRPRP